MKKVIALALTLLILAVFSGFAFADGGRGMEVRGEVRGMNGPGMYGHRHYKHMHYRHGHYRHWHKRYHRHVTGVKVRINLH
ncbi:MAG: hypothetical protein HQK89_06775 [Nitrospirae bacterium]|nr:hypothetical protein [Nitrospirota bacterium]